MYTLSPKMEKVQNKAALLSKPYNLPVIVLRALKEVPAADST